MNFPLFLQNSKQRGKTKRAKWKIGNALSGGCGNDNRTAYAFVTAKHTLSTRHGYWFLFRFYFGVDSSRLKCLNFYFSWASNGGRAVSNLSNGRMSCFFKNRIKGLRILDNLIGAMQRSTNTRVRYVWSSRDTYRQKVHILRIIRGRFLKGENKVMA